MAVSKELLARYKEMKAKGIQITLSELKAQMESESVSGGEVTPLQSSEQSTYTTSNSPDYSENSYPTEQSSTIGYAQQNYSDSTTNSINSYSNPQQDCTSYSGANTDNYSNWTTTYSNTTTSTVETKENYSEPYQPYDTYSGNLPTIGSDITSEKVGQDNANLADTVNSPTRKFAVIGYPLGHSLSSYIHEAGFKSLGLKASYEILETPPESLVDRIKYMKNNNYCGFNVTIPLKLPVTMFLDEIDTSVDLVKAVNTVVINPVTKELKGYNTDAIGFKNAIPEDFTLCGKVAGVLGTGGAARAAITALAQSQMKEIKLYTRNVPNCLELLNYLRETFPNVEFNAYQIERIRDLSEIDLLVNTTPIGMQGRAADFTPVEENELKTLPPSALVYDVIYNPKKTVLLKLAQKHGYRTVNGIDMFIHQALAAEQIWTGRTPDFKDMKIAALENL